MKAKETKTKERKAQIEPVRSKYAGKPLDSEKEASAKKHEKTAMEILKQLGK